jgi:cell division protein FtsB
MNSEFISKIYRGLIKNRYLLAGVIFIVWTALIDSNSYSVRLRLQSDLEKLKTEKIFYQKKIKQDSLNLSELKTNKANLEKFAREKYLMKKENEDIFIIVPKKEDD